MTRRPGLPGVEAGVNLGEPVIQTEPTMEGESWIILSDEFGPFAGGTTVVCNIAGATEW